MPSLRSRFPVELGSVRDPEAQVGRLHRLAVAGGPGWGLSRLLQRVVQVDGENSAGQTGLFLSALLGRSSAVRLLLAFGANPNHRCLDGSTPVHAGAFSGRSLVVLQLLRAGGDLRLRDQQGRTPRDWAEQGGAEQSREVLELLQLCRAHISALVYGAELAATASLGQLPAGSGHSLCGSLSLRRLVQVGRAPRLGQIRRPPQIPALGFGQLSSLWPLGLVTGIPLADPKELLPAQSEPDRTYMSSSHTLMANLLWRGHPVTVRQLAAAGSQPDVLLADLQHCRCTPPASSLGSPVPQTSLLLPSRLEGFINKTRESGSGHGYRVFTCGPAPGMEPSYWSDRPPLESGYPFCVLVGCRGEIVSPWYMVIRAQEQPHPCELGPPREWPALLPTSTLHHPNLLLLMALSPSADLSGLCLLFEPVWLGSLHVVLHPRGPSEGGPRPVPGLLPGRLLLQVLEALLFLQARWRAHGGLSSHAVQLVRPGLAKVGSLEHGRPLHQCWQQPRPQQGYLRGGPGPGLPPPPELYPWLPLELICGDMPAATSDLYSFCVLAQEVFTGELPWAGRQGPEVKAQLEAGESPALDPRVPAPYQALVRAGLGLGPADRWGSLQSSRYLLREAMAQDPAPEVSSPMDRTTLCPAPQGSPPETLYYKVASRAKTTPRPVPPVMSLSPSPSQALEIPEVMGHSGVQRGPSPSCGLCLGHSPTPRVSLHCGLEPSSTGPALHSRLQDSASLLVTQGSVEHFQGKFCRDLSPVGAVAPHTQGCPAGPPALSPELIRGGLFSSLQKMDLLEEIIAELQGGCQLGDRPSHDSSPGTDS